MITRIRSRLYYGWYMVGAGAIIQLITGGLLNQAAGAYLVLLQSEFGWSKTAISGAFSLFRFESGLLGPLGGWLIDRFGSRAVMRFGLLIFGLGFIMFSRVDSIFTFYVAFAIIAIGQNLGGFLPLTVAIVNWFHRRRSIALATMQTGFAVGGLGVPIIVYCLENFGWRTTALASGLVIIFAGLPLTTVMRSRPEDYGLELDGGPAASASSDNESAVVADEPVDFRAGEAMRTSSFWLISFGHGSALLVVSAVMVHLVPHLHENLGYPLETAGLVVGLLASMQIIGQILGGFLGDRFSKRVITSICMGMHMAGLLMVAYATSLPMIIAFAVLHGLGWGIRGPLMQSMRADYFGRGSFGMIMGISSMVTTIGNTAGPLVAGFLADTTGSYETGFTVLALMAGAGSVFFITSARPRPPARIAMEAAQAS